MFNKEDLSESEKIDYIYRTLRRQNISKNIFLLIKVLVLWVIIYFYYYIYPKLDIEAISKQYIIPQISKIAQEAASSVLSWSIDTAVPNSNINIDPKLLEQIRNFQKK